VLSDGTSTDLYGLGRIGQQEAEWAHHLPDALGSVRQLAEATGAVSYAAAYEPYGEALAAFGSQQTAYGFVGEWTDETGLVYLRARYYDGQIGRFLSRDDLASFAEKPATLNRWLYADDSPTNYVDPSGNVPVKIWTAAFIEPTQITFPYPFTYPFVGIDFFAQWNGNGRAFFTGGARPSSKVWHEIRFDTTNPDVISKGQGTDVTIVRYLGVFVNVGHAPSPSTANVTYPNSQIWIEVKASAANPLIPFAPAIDYSYTFAFDLNTGAVAVIGEYDFFPWHEVFLQVDNKGYEILNAPPSGPNKNPLDLGYDQSHRPKLFWWENIPALIETGDTCNELLVMGLAPLHRSILLNVTGGRK